MAKPVNEREGACPFIDCDDARCDVRFSLSRLDQAFHVCLNGGYVRCPTYYQLAGYTPSYPTGLVSSTSVRGPHRDADRDAPIRLTLHGRVVRGTGDGSELRPTGS